MVSYFELAILGIVLVAGATAEPPRPFNRFQNRKVPFARQEVTPYPPAGIKPDIPFDLPNEEAAAFVPDPDQTYGPPDQTYGPPDQTYGPPDQTYGPPDQTYEPPQSAPEDADEQVTDEPEAERLIFSPRRPVQSLRLQQQLPRKTQPITARRPLAPKKSAALRRPARLQAQSIISHPIYLRDGSLVYSIRV